MRACRRQLCICRRMPHTPFGRVRSLIFPRPVLFVRSAPLHHRRGQVCLRRGNAPISKGALAFARVACVRVCGRACSARLHAHACLHASMRSTHARMRAPTHTQAHAPTHPRTHTRTLASSHPPTFARAHTRTQRQTYARTYGGTETGCERWGQHACHGAQAVVCWEQVSLCSLLLTPMHSTYVCIPAPGHACTHARMHA